MTSRFISYLDLMCCGFGGALLMFLIVASARPRTEAAQPMLIVRCHAVPTDKGSPATAGGELGIEYRLAGSKEWIRANGLPKDSDLVDGPPRGEKWAFLPKTAPNQPAEAVLICRHPRPGRWEFRAYLADYSTSDAPFRVEFEFLGASEIRSNPAALVVPGTLTPPVEIEIGGKK